MKALFVFGVASTWAYAATPVTAAKSDPARARLGQPDSAAQARILESYGKLPLSFEENRGQTDPHVKFLSRGNGHTLFLTPNEAVLAFKKGSSKVEGQQSKVKSGKPENPTLLRMHLVGANSRARVGGLEQLPGKANYFIGNDHATWHTNVPTYAKVEYQGIYPGIDLVYYGNQRQLEYDFVVAPGADPKAIHLSFRGATRMHIDKVTGDLVLSVGSDQIRFLKPVVYQRTTNEGQTTAEKQFIEAGYVAKGKEVGFQIAAYDTSKPLIIDPVLVNYSTYLGGSNSDLGLGIAVDAAGNAYVTGRSSSSNFPTSPSAYQPTFGGSYEVFVTKLNPLGTGLLYSTYLGGNSFDYGIAIAVDAAGNAYVTGYTFSTNFPTTPSAYQTTYQGTRDAFVTKLNPLGTGLLYSTYLGGGSEDIGFGIAVDAAENAYVTGNTYSSNFPTTTGPIQSASGDAFVTKLNSLGTGLVYSTYLGGNNYDFGLGIAVDAAGHAYVTGYTYSTNFPTTTGAYQTTNQGDRDAFVTKVNPLGTSLVYSTYLGGSNYDFGYGIAVDVAGNAYVTGNTSSINFPTTAGAYQTTSGGSFDAFVSKLNPLGAGLVYSTYLGGSNADEGQGIAVDAAGNAYVTGFTLSSNFPTTTGAYQTTNQGDRDTFVTKVNPLGTGLLYSTYLGGNSYDQGLGIAVDAAGNAYVTGDTYSSNFPATAGAYQTTNHGSENAFVTKLGGFPRFNQPPIASAGVSYSGNEGAAIAMSGATASDPDSDTLTYSWSISNATLCSFSNAGVLNPNLTCSDNGAFTATLTVNDAYNPAVTSNASVTVNNVRPSAMFRNNGPVNEGSSINLSLTSPSDPSSVDTTTGFKYAFDCGSGYNTLSAVSNAACATNDNGMRILKGKIQDKDGGFTEYTATVMVNNVAPTVTVTGPASGSIYPVGTPVTFAGTFTDPGILDTHTARWTFDALTAAGVVTESGGNGSVSGTYTFTIPGVYQVTLAVTDKDSGAAAASMIGALTAMVVIYDPNGGFVTGGGWIDSPIGAYLANPSLVGKANFGFMSKYQKGATVPAGETEFQFKVANFHSTSYNWLVIAGARAQYKGSGTINGVGDYAFLLTAIDGQVNGGGGVDKFRIKIWDKNTSAIIYDNQMGQGDDSNATTALGGGSIVIHQ